MITRLGIISDAHGNDVALSRCLDFMRRLAVDRIIFLGDAIGYFPHGAAVCRMLEQAGALCLKGNHEAMLFGELGMSPEIESIAGLDRFCKELPSGWRGQIEENGAKLTLDIHKRRLLLVHGSPENALEGYVHDPKDIVCDQDVDAVIMGHTHRPFLYNGNGRLFLNPGSCGMPRDCGELLSVAVLDLNRMRAEVFRFPFTTPQDMRKMVHPKVRDCLDRRCADPYGTIRSNANEAH